MISVPDAWQLPKISGLLLVSQNSLTKSSENVGSISGKKCQSQSTGSPASSQWPDGVSLPREVSCAQPQVP